MKPHPSGRWGGALAVLVLVVTASCGGAQSTPDPGDGSLPPPSSEASLPPATEAPAPPAATEAPPPEPALTVASEIPPLENPVEGCGVETTMVATNTPLEIDMFGTKQYLCVMVPEGMAQLTFEISDMTAALNLFVGYPNLSTLEAGGGQFWASERGGRDDESIIIEPGADGFIEPGSYFVEISGGASADGASFVLTVTMP